MPEIDPTKTITIRNQAAAAVGNHYSQAHLEIMRIVFPDESPPFGYTPPPFQPPPYRRNESRRVGDESPSFGYVPTPFQPPPYRGDESRRVDFLRRVISIGQVPRFEGVMADPELYEDFLEYIHAQIGEHIIDEDDPFSTAWLIPFVFMAYDRGVQRAVYDFFRGEPVPRIVGFLKTKHEQVKDIIRNRVRGLLLGHTDEMEARIAQLLTRAALIESSRNEVVAELRKAFGFSEGKSKLMIRTEIVNAWNQGLINEGLLREFETGERVLVQWICKFRNSRRTHIARHNKIFTLKQAQRLVGEPNCQCGMRIYFGLLRPQGITSSMV